MNYSSDFSQSDSEYLYQQIEELKGYLSVNALFLIEQIDDDTCEEGARVVFKVKDNDRLFLVDSSAGNILIAARAAKEKLIELICAKQAYEYKPYYLIN